MIEAICICGAGTMGTGIAQTCAVSGFSTILFDVNKTMLEKGKNSIEKGLQISFEKGRITAEQKQQALDRIILTGDINNCIADIIIEAIVEDTAIKIAMFNQLAEVNHSETIFATNTSSLSVSSIAKGVMHPGRIAGMHFFNPAPVMKLVEIVKATDTRQEVIDTLYELAKRLDKTPVLCKDAPGFIVNHVARPYYIEALRLLEKGEADIETIDTLLEATGFKMGPFRLMDLIGNDINYAVSNSVYGALGKPERLKPSFIQKEKCDKGELGRKTKKGYYNY